MKITAISDAAPAPRQRFREVMWLVMAAPFR
jgi:hypothetical protein